jgi:predicted transcriptional regulator
MGRKSAKLELEVFHEGNLVSKALLAAQMIER